MSNADSDRESWVAERRREIELCIFMSPFGTVDSRHLSNVWYLMLIYSLGRDRSVCLTVPQMMELHNRMKTSYDRWLRNAPATYTTDDFFSSRQPVAVTSRYGQNQQFGGSEANAEVEDRNWKDDRPWEEISQVTVALATHIR